MNNFPGLNYGPKKSDWLNYPPPPLKAYLLKPQWQKILIGRNPDQLQIIIQHENRDFTVLYMKSSFDLLRTQKQAINQSNKQFIIARLFSIRRRIIEQTPDSNTPIPITSCATFP